MTGPQPPATAPPGQAQPWQAELQLDKAAVVALIARRFKDLAGRPVAHIGAGWDNDVWEVGATATDPAWFVRVPRRELGAELLPIEAAVLPGVEARVASPCGVAVPGSARFGPASEDSGDLADDLPWGIMAVRPVEGDEIGHLNSPASARWPARSSRSSLSASSSALSPGPSALKCSAGANSRKPLARVSGP